ncbi:neutral cholesterol ester hydrolase 1-like [Gigantopelta aegis]|uniref:neutral cholesterol ester hydrolase 1-like n=1 Tax=Gigantopelta aegis TaxID=1735272 RepID=UPI001B8887A7|nr:neutral cholesterol ester hydrolase 1-like [Gigantopelta aegis]
MHRKLPKGLENKRQLRWLDELGRIANAMEHLMERLGLDPTVTPVKTVVNKALSLILNPTPWINHFPNIEMTPGEYAGVPMSVYRKMSESADHVTPRPVFIYFHGGGWTWFSTEAYDLPMRHLANSTGFIVIAVDYRTAPQHPFPAAFEDCLAVTRYVLAHTNELNLRKDLVVVAGDGSGGNLAAAVSTVLEKHITMQVLINPALQMMNFATPSYQDNARRLPGLTSSQREASHWLRYANLSMAYRTHLLKNSHVSKEVQEEFKDFLDSNKRLPRYLKVTNKTTKGYRESKLKKTKQFDSLVSDATFSPMMFEDVESLPNAYVITSQFDVLRDEAIMFAHRVLDSGVKVKLNHYPKAFHGFFLFAGNSFWNFPSSEQAMKELVDFINFQFIKVEGA